MTGLRWAAAALVVGWMTLGPVYRQVFNGHHKAFPAWHMYRHFGLNLWRVDVVEHTSEGPVPLDRLAWLGYDDWREAPMAVRRVNSEAQLRDQVAHICGRLPASSDVRVRAWKATLSGWEPRFHGRRNWCP